MPSHLADLPDAIQRRACFVGLSSVTLKHTDDYAGGNDWHREVSAEDASRLPQWIVDWSSIVERECRVHEVPFVDLATDWEAGAMEVREVFERLGDR